MDSTALICLGLAARAHGKEFSPRDLAEAHGLAEGQEPDVALLRRMLAPLGLDLRVEPADWGRLLASDLLLPLAVQLGNGRYVVVTELRPGDAGAVSVQLFDPLAEGGGQVVLEREAFEQAWQRGSLVRLRRLEREGGDGAITVGLGWFLSELRSQPLVFAEIILATLLLHVLSFATPLFSMVTLDRVTSTRSYETLHVLFIGAVLAVLCHSFLGGLRSFLLLHAAGRLDIRLAELSWRRLLSLPLDFFQRHSAGSLVKHMGQATQLREFMTGTLAMTLLEALALVIFLPVLALFSGTLTLIVLGTSALIGLNLLVVLRAYRRRLQESYVVEGERQAMLVETIAGIETVKSLALERSQLRQWLERSARLVQLQRGIGGIHSVSTEISGLLQKLMVLLIVWVGVMQVLAGELTVGALVAFNLMSMRVSMPLVQLIQLLAKMEQAGLSMRMLTTVLAQPAERRLDAGSTQAVRGHIRFEQVGYRYPAAPAPALERFSLDIPAGSTVGVVGRSGSGKSTLTRLLQGLCLPGAGVLRIDGLDIREYNLSYLRRQIGVVPQVCHLFRGSIRDNIAIGNPACSPDLVLEAARLAGVDEFAETLAQGFDTFLEEDGANISMGQRQRIALARALVKRPAILILDEATSALDADTETRILRHFHAIAEGRTVVMVSHRLCTLTHLDLIVVMEAGRIVDAAPHEVLLARNPLYQSLWRQQFAPVVAGGAA